jgi:hypothetical protein
LKNLRSYIIPLFFGCLVLLPLLFLLFLQGAQTWARHEAEERMEKESLQTITLDRSSFTWYEEGKEILIDGNLFDVTSWSQKNDQYTFTGIYDTQETAIVQLLNKQQGQKEYGIALVNLLLLMHGFLAIVLLTQLQFFAALRIRCSLFITRYPNTFLSVHLLPPRVHFQSV